MTFSGPYAFAVSLHVHETRHRIHRYARNDASEGEFIVHRRHKVANL